MRGLLLYIATFWRLLVVVRNWPVYFRNRFGWMKGDVTYRLRCGVVITSRTFKVDGGALNDVWFDESYEPSRFGIPFNWQRCRTIVDIGANIGTFTTFAAYKSKEAMIISVEPEPGNLQVLQRNVNDNHFENRVTIVPAAVGGKSGTMTLHVSNRSSGGHSLFHKYGDTHEVEVNVVSLADIFQKHSIETCDFLKLDCEGGEYDALYSLSDEALARIRFMAVEYHHFSSDPRHTPAALKAFLSDHGFRVTPSKKSMFFAERA